MRTVCRAAVLILLSALLLPVPGVEAQMSTGLGIGWAAPYGKLGDSYGSGFTVRGQVGLDLPLVKPHLQAGWTRVPYDGGGGDSKGSANIYHTAVGARFSLGLIWVGANAAYFFGHGDGGFGFFPEAGVSFWKLEAVGDIRVDGSEKWAAFRVGLSF